MSVGVKVKFQGRMPTGLKLRDLLYSSVYNGMVSDVASAYLSKHPWKSLNQLAREDHPYAKRHGFLGRFGAAGGNSIGWYEVYQRSGKAFQSVIVKDITKRFGRKNYVRIGGRLIDVEGSSKAAVRITYDLRRARYLKYVFGGTKVMIDRDPVHYGVSDDWNRRWKKQLLKSIMYQFGLNPKRYIGSSRVKS
jgi:hypothetical protein